jgi:hypothetical protein
MRRIVTASLTFGFLAAATAGSAPGLAAVAMLIPLAALAMRGRSRRAGAVPPGVRYVPLRRVPDNVVPFDRFRTARPDAGGQRGDGEQPGERPAFRTPPAA